MTVLGPNTVWELLHIAKMSEEALALSVQLWAFSADFLVLWISFVRCRSSCAGASYPYFVSDTISG